MQMLDIEQKRVIVGELNWNYQVLYAAMGAIMNTLLINNSLKSDNLLIITSVCSATFISILYGSYGD